ncbi:hypothetical protein K469DRAFT_688167 [Zopfia rhizophila CBS 207.26]|uniref:Uncharacterized protein n=1 Tax=Zopfia rhizophila CBS 207.26 TaxID=1314779 RepID=A0A6A6E310_9PEZI|nr:hypothetical protein K469DRAFT_688167 [Zopfia rhizophila CBS 207.26]
MPHSVHSGSGSSTPKGIDGSQNENTPLAIVGMSMQFPDDANTPERFWNMIQEGRNASRNFPADRMGAAIYHPDNSRHDSRMASLGPHKYSPRQMADRVIAGIPLNKVAGTNTSCYTGNLSTDYRSFVSQDLDAMSKQSINCLPSLLSGRLSWFFDLHGPNLSLDTACSSGLVALDLGCKTLTNGSSDMTIVTGCCLLFSQELYHFLGNMGMLSPDSKSYSFDHRCNGYGRGEGIAALVIKRLPDAVRNGDTIRGVIRAVGTNHDGRTPSTSHPNKLAQTALIKETYAKAGLSMEPTRYFEAHGTGTPTGDPIEAYAIGAAFRGYRSYDDPLYLGSVKGNIGHTGGASGLASVIKACLIMEKGVIPRGANFEKLNPRIDDIGLNVRLPAENVPWPSTGLRRISVNSFGASGTNAHVVLDDAYHFLIERGIQGNHCTLPVPAIGGALTPNGSTNGYSNGPSMTSPRLLLLSGLDKAALNRQIEQYTTWLQSSPESAKSSSFLEDLAYTLTQRRTHHTTRSYAIVDSHNALTDLKPQMSAPIRSRKEPHVGFVFTGQGAQWAGMGRELLRFPIFRDNVLESNTYLQRIGFSWDIWDVLRDTKHAAINSPMLSQTLCTVIQVAIADLLLALNLTPAAVVGHSSGEIGAAYAAGAISKQSALRLAYHRGVLSEYLAKGSNNSHGMMAVGLSPQAVQPLIDEVAKSHPKAPALVVACINSPESVTISGEVQQLDDLAAVLAEQQHFHRKLKVDVAYHSLQMEQVATAYKESVESLVSPEEPRRTALMVSSVTGDIVEPKRLRDVDYWVQNMQQAVRFSDAVIRLCITPGTSSRRKKLDGSHRKNVTIQLLLEVGPHAALQGPIRDTLKSSPSAATISYYSALLRGKPADRTLLSVLGSIACHGRSIDLDLANNLDDSRAKQPKVLPDLPEYAFDHSNTYWPTTRLGREFRFRRHEKLDLVGRPVMDWNPLEARWRNILKLSELPWAGDHKINEAIIYPAVGMVVMAVEAAKQLADPARELRGYNITDAYFLSALTIPETPEGIETNLILRPQQSDLGRKTDAWAFFLYSYDNGTWVKNCNGKIQLDYEEAEDEVDKGAQQRNLVKNRTDQYKTAVETAKYVRSRSQFYDSARRSGYTFGPSFYRMDDLHYSNVDGDQCTATVSCFQWHTVDNRNHVQPHVVHPCTLDGMLQVCVATYSRAGEEVVSTAIPVEIESLWISDKGLSYPDVSFIKSVAKLGRSSNMGYETSASAFDPEINNVLLDMKGGRFRFVAKDSASGELDEPQICYSVQWKPDIALLDKKAASEVVSKPKSVKFAGQDGVQGPLLAFLELVTFKTPGLKILHLSHGPSWTQQQLVEAFYQPKDAEHHHVLPHGDYTLVTVPKFSEEDLKSTTEKYDGIKAVTWDGSQTLIPEVAEPETYDLVFLSWNAVNLLPRAAQVLKSGGELVLLDAAVPLSEPNGHYEAPATQLRSSLEENGLSIIEEFTDADKLVISTKPVKALEKSPMQFALVVEQGSMYQQKLAYTLQKAILETAHDCQIRSLPNLQPAAEAKLAYIFLSELENPTLEKISSELFFVLQQTLGIAKGVLWLTAQEENGQIPPSRTMVDGLARVVRAENQECIFTIASLESGSLDNLVASIMTLIKISDFSSTGHAYEPEYRQRNGQFLIGRMIESRETTKQVLEKSLPVISKKMALKDCPPLRMWVSTPGLLDTLHFIEDTGYYNGLGLDEVEVKVDVIGLNFKDLLLALGRIEGTTFGHECAGIVSRVGSNVTDMKPGDRVCAVSPTAFSTYSRVPRDLVARVPDALSLEHAVCIPTQMCVSYYGLIEIAKLKKGETVLIHSAAGGTGQWAVQVAQQAGAEVYATVGSEKKKTFLMKQYEIPEDHIFSSRNTLFAEGIMRMTNNRGVDVVLNSLAGEALLASWNIIAAYGRFIEMGRKDIAENNNLPMRPFIRGATFMALEISTLAKDDPSIVAKNIEVIFQDQVNGIYRPVEPLQVMPIQDVEKAFRMLQDGQMIGKIILKMTDDSVIPTVIQAKPSFSFDANKTYVIAGGTGGLGRATAEWMIKERGGKNLILLSRSGMRNEAAAKVIRELNEAGAHVEAPSCDIADAAALKAVLDKYSKTMPPIGGCMQASMVLRDAFFENMSYADWKTSVDPKVQGSWNLHTLLPKGMDFFILLSSIAGVLGNAGQANYAAGNTYMDGLARYRVAQGERAVSLDLGAVLGHGVLAEDETLRERLLKGGLLSGVSSALMFGLLDYYCDPARGVLTQENSQVCIGVAPPSKLRNKMLDDPSNHVNLPFYSHIVNSGKGGQADGGAESASAKYKAEFLAADSITKAGDVVSRALVERLMGSQSKAIDMSEVDFSRPMHDFGVDSLMAIELRAWFAKEFVASVPIFEILSEGSLETLGVSVALKSKLWSS